MTLAVAKIGPYEVKQVLGEGGMGRVFRAHDPDLDREVALKLLKPELVDNEIASQRFLREARTAASLSHPRVVTVFQVGNHEGIPFLVMELVDGEDLQARLARDGKLPVEEALTYIRDAAEGLEAADRVGLVHRDVKPGNLIVHAGRAKLTDFGLARPLDGSSDVTRTGVVVGTPAYVAPEVAHGKDATRQSDIYALGCTLFEILTGDQPFRGETIAKILSQQIHDAPPDILTLRPDAPRALATLIERMLAKDPIARPQGYDELIELIDAVREPTGPTRPFSESSLPQVAIDPAKVSGKFAQVKSEERTVMQTHLEGFSARTALADSNEVERWLDLHDALLRPVVDHYGGIIEKTHGDVVVSTYATSKDALKAGAAIQDRLALYNEQARADERIRAKITLARGPVRRLKNDVRGEAVHLAAALEELAEPGDVIFSGAVAPTFDEDTLDVEPRGNNALRGLAGAGDVYALKRGPGPLPFDGRTLPDDLDDARPAAAAARSRVRLFVVAGVVIGLAGALYFASGRGPEQPVARVDAQAELAALEAVTARTPAQELARGHALDEVGRRDDAFAAYALAAAGGAHDDQALDFVVDRFENDGDAATLELLVAWPDKEVVRRMRSLIGNRRWKTRHGAATVLRKRRASYNAEPMAILDLEQGGSCKARAGGVKALITVGKTPRALSAVREAQNKSGNDCMKSELAQAEAKIKARVNQR